MTEIQKQVEQFVKDHWKWDDGYKDTALYRDVYTLIRSVVEECCELMGESGFGKVFEDKIRRHFAWLDEKNA